MEEQFYLFWPAIVYFLSKRFLGGAIAFLISFPIVLRTLLLFLHLPDRSLIILYTNTFCRIDSLAIGAGISVLLRSESWLPYLIRYSRFFYLSSFCILAAIFISQGELNDINPLVQSFGYSVLAVFFGSLLILSLSLSDDSILVRILSWFPLRYLGRISYSFYVYHFFILFLFRDILAEHILRLTHSYWISELFLVLFFGIGIGAIASLSWYFLEKPILKLKRYFPTRQNSTQLNTNIS